MIIPITLPDATSKSNPKLPPTLAKISHDEIVLIELQGALDVGDMDPSERNGKLVGKLDVDDGLKKATLLIGHHLLEGKIAPIPKPLAIMHRTNTSTPQPVRRKRKDGGSTGAMEVDGGENQEDDDMEDDDMEALERADATPQWTIIGLVKRKIIFSKRPMPVIKR